MDRIECQGCLWVRAQLAETKAKLQALLEKGKGYWGEEEVQLNRQLQEARREVRRLEERAEQATEIYGNVVVERAALQSKNAQLWEALNLVYEAYLAPPEESSKFDWDEWGRNVERILESAKREERTEE